MAGTNIICQAFFYKYAYALIMALLIQSRSLGHGHSLRFLQWDHTYFMYVSMYSK